VLTVFSFSAALGVSSELSVSCTQVEKNRDPDAEAKALAWLAQVVGKPAPEGSYDESLKNGVFLCE